MHSEAPSGGFVALRAARRLQSVLRRPAPMAQPLWLTIEGARQNNLKTLSLKLPHDRMTVITGVSGSGKSSLAFDTLFVEGQWRYIESLSTYARMFLELLDRPHVDRIGEIPPP